MGDVEISFHVPAQNELKHTRRSGESRVSKSRLTDIARPCIILLAAHGNASYLSHVTHTHVKYQIAAVIPFLSLAR
jgi:hypothetical protein